MCVFLFVLFCIHRSNMFSTTDPRWGSEEWSLMDKDKDMMGLGQGVS